LDANEKKGFCPDFFDSLELDFETDVLPSGKPRKGTPFSEVKPSVELASSFAAASVAALELFQFQERQQIMNKTRAILEASFESQQRKSTLRGPVIADAKAGKQTEKYLTCVERADVTKQCELIIQLENQIQANNSKPNCAGLVKLWTATKDQLRADVETNTKRPRNTVAKWIRFKRNDSTWALGQRGRPGVVSEKINEFADFLVTSVYNDPPSMNNCRKGVKGMLKKRFPAASDQVIKKVTRTCMKLLEPYTTKRKPEFTTDVRTEAKESLLNLISLYSVAYAMGCDALAADLVTNTDKTVLCYNLSHTGEVQFIFVPKHCGHVKITEKQRNALPQRIDLLKSISASGDQGPPILVKKVQELKGSKIWVIPFRGLTRLGSTGNHGELWLVPKDAGPKDVFAEYYSRILPQFIQTCINRCA
jgi:hypothetical protein